MTNAGWLKSLAILCFTTFGVLSILFIAGELFAIYVWHPHSLAPPSGFAHVRELSIAVLGGAIGVGLIRLRKWAAILFSFATLACAMWLIIGSILHVPRPYMFYNFAFAMVFIIPTVATATCWRLLAWKRTGYS
jgi:hypothetical protein